MRSPALVATKRRANRKSNQSQKKHTKFEAGDQESTREFSVYDGRIRLGTVREIDGEFIAISGKDDRELGRFDNVTAAADQVDADFGGER